MKVNFSQSSTIIWQLNRIKTLGWNAIIAGSAIRDWYHNKPVSSINVFIEYSKDIDVHASMLEDFESLAWLDYWVNIFLPRSDVNIENIQFLGDHKSNKHINDHILAVWTISSSGTFGKNYYIIMLDKDPKLYVEENFDFGICMAYTDGKKIHFSNEFITDSMNHTITLYPKNLTPFQLEYAFGQHLTKLYKKYPGWSLVVPTPK